MVNSTSVLMIFTSIMLSLIITELKAIEISTSKSFWCILKRPKLKPDQKFVCGQFWANIEIMPTLSLGQVRPRGQVRAGFIVCLPHYASSAYILVTWLLLWQIIVNSKLSLFVFFKFFFPLIHTVKQNFKPQKFQTKAKSNQTTHTHVTHISEINPITDCFKE